VRLRFLAGLAARFQHALQLLLDGQVRVEDVERPLREAAHLQARAERDDPLVRPGASATAGQLQQPLGGHARVARRISCP